MASIRRGRTGNADVDQVITDMQADTYAQLTGVPRMASMFTPRTLCTSGTAVVLSHKLGKTPTYCVAVYPTAAAAAFHITNANASTITIMPDASFVSSFQIGVY
jgi:hypothetical protein